MSATLVVKHFDAVKHAGTNRLEGRINPVVGPLVLQASEESFCDGVIVAVTGPRHRASDTRRSQRPLIRLAGVLAVPIAVVQDL